jgi:uncharacterized CHY-type Zn-finger protein
MGIKCGDNLVVYACSSCHQAIDSAGREQYAADKIRAIEETQEKLIEKGLMVIA